MRGHLLGLIACVALLVATLPGVAVASAASAGPIAPAHTSASATAGPPAGGTTAPSGAAGPVAGPVGPAQTDCGFPVSATDATGATVTVREGPERVVVLAPSTAQIAWEVGAAPAVVGMPVGPYTSYLNGSGDRTNVWNPDGSVNQEAVVGLEPDLVLTADLTPNTTVRDLRSAGLTVYKSPLDRSLSSITEKVTTFGRLLGACEEAAATTDAFDASLAEIRATAPERSPRVLYYFFNFTAGSGTFVHEAIETAGGENVAATAGIEGFAPLNEEVVAARDPQWIVVPGSATVPDREPFASTSAVRANRTLVVDDNYVSQPAPRVVIPMRKMAEAFARTETRPPAGPPPPPRRPRPRRSRPTPPTAGRAGPPGRPPRRRVSRGSGSPRRWRRCSRSRRSRRAGTDPAANSRSTDDE